MMAGKRSLMVLMVGLAMGLSMVLPVPSARAEPCKPFPIISPQAPMLGHPAVPTNTKIWFTAPSVRDVTVRGNNASIATTVELVVDGGSRPSLYVATPEALLSPGFTYTATVTSPDVELPTSWHFTAASGPDSTPPSPMSEVIVHVSKPYSGPLYCDGYGDYGVNVSGFASIMDAAIYVLEELRDDRYVPIGFNSFAWFPNHSVDQLPTPLYRIRTLSLAGLSPSDSALPTGMSDRVTSGNYEQEDGGGCSTGGGAGVAMLPLLLALGTLLLLPRRRSSR